LRKFNWGLPQARAVKRTFPAVSLDDITFAPESKTLASTTFSTSMLDSDTPPEAVRRAVDLSRLKEEGIEFIKLARTQTANLTDKAADGLSEAKDQLFAIEYSKLPKEVLDWIKEHPYQTAFHVVNGVVFFAPE
jgi:hypothetical protein